jgi:hypothetical protein
MTLKQTAIKAGMTLKKHSPAIFTGVGVIGLGATAYLAYKSRDKVEAVVEEIERKRDLEIPINKVEVAKDLSEALYKPVLVGVASVAAILFAQKIQNTRIKTLVGALAVEQARNIYFEKKYKKQHGEEAYREFATPVNEIEHIEVDKKGKEKITVTKVKDELDKSIGQWYDESEHYVSDDHQYNIAMIDSIKDKLETIMFQRGHLTLNEVREALGFDRIRAGALLGWSTADSFNITTDTVVEGDNEMGMLKDNIYVSWSHPRYVHMEVEFNGRYSIHG